jgi:Ca2+-binding RTX toxin-like protein
MTEGGKRRGRIVTFVTMAAAGSIVATVGTSVAADDDVELRYIAAVGEINDVSLVETEGGVVITDTGASALPRSLKGCTEVSVPIGVSATCPASGDVLIVIDLGDGNDHVLADMLTPRFTLHVFGGDGDDAVEPGDGDDRIVGGAGDDTLYGGYGDDEVLGQAGVDLVKGSPGADVLDGGADFDFLFGEAGADVVIGGGDFDYIFGGGGPDIIDGGPGADFLSGDGGADTLLGGAGDDEIVGGGGTDVMDGDGGNDLLRGRDGEVDSMTCGSGTDVARIDAGGLDVAHPSCEKIRVEGA